MIIQSKIEQSLRCYGGGGGGSSAYERKGTGIHTKEKTVPSYIGDLVTSNASSASPDPALVTAQKGMFTNLISNASQPLPADSKMTELLNRSGEGYDGQSSAQAIAARNPFNGSYEAATDAAFKQRASDAMAGVATGPDAVRGATARTSIGQSQLATRLANERGKEVHDAQMRESGNVLAAINMMNQVQKATDGVQLAAGNALNQGRMMQQNMGLQAAKGVDASKLNNLQLLQLAAGLQGKTVDTQVDDFSGKGDQSNWQAGLDCCFIFLQARNGILPWFINMARRDYYTPQRKRGYKWMARWLVPMMQKSKMVEWVVNAVMIKPFLRYGAWLYKDASASWRGVVSAPICKAWLATWNWLGKVV